MALHLAAMTAPTINDNAPDFHPYNCHMAVMHWAVVAFGESLQKTQETVQKMARRYCPACKGKANCTHRGSLQNHEYAKIFCGVAKPVNPAMCGVGDVVIVPHPTWPAHSMVVVSVNGNSIGVRGFNNTGTFAGAPFLQYDPITRLLEDRTSPLANPVFQIDQEDFLLKMRNLSRLFSVHSAAQHGF